MKKFLKKSLVYLVMTMLVVPATLIMGILSAQKAEASESLGSISAEDFGVVDYNTGLGQLKGYTAGFGLTDATFDTAKSIVMKLYAANDQLLQTNTATSKVSSLVGAQAISSPFDVFGSFDYVIDGYWTNVRESQYGQNVFAKKVVITATLANDKVVTSTNEVLTGEPITIYPNGAIYNGNTGVVYTTLSGAILSASANDTIYVKSGEYVENIAITKPLNIIATGGTVVIASVTLNSLGIVTTNITANNVNVIAPAKIQSGIDLVVARKSKTDENGNVLIWNNGSKDQYVENIVINKNITMFSPNFLPLGIEGFSDSTGQNLPVLKALIDTKPVLDINSDATVFGFNFSGASTAIAIGSGFSPEIHSNVFANTGLGVDKTGSENISAESNFWGSALEPVAKIAGLVSYSPWYTDNTFASLAFKKVGDTVAITTAVGETNYIDGKQVTLNIPAGTEITGQGWDGTLNVGKITSLGATVITASGELASDAMIIEIGAGNQGLTLTKGSAKITFAGRAGIEHVGYVKDGKFVEITSLCQGETIPVGSNECKAVVGDDLIVVTNHFTQFVSFNTSVTAPIISTVSQIEKDGQNYISVAWANTGATSYEFYIDGILTAPVSINGNTANLKVNAIGKHLVKMKAVVSGTASAFSNVKEVTISAIVPAVTVTEVEPTIATVAPEKVQAAVNPAPAPEQTVETAKDDQGIIKGEEKKDEKNETNWTPWIILFILILFAGAATGGYFYWFAGKDEEIVGETKISKVEKKPEVKVTVKTKAPVSGKKSKRW